MAKKNLKNALKAHEAKRSQAAKLKAVEEAAKRKAASIRPGNHHVKRQKKVERDQKSKKYVQPFRQEDTILLVGEGNFSFAHSLLLEPHNHDPDLILATALDSEQECYEKYPDARQHVEEMRRIAGRDSIVIFHVDAGNLEIIKEVTGGSNAIKDQISARWSKVVFNFPHVGAGHKDESRNILSNQLMLLRFLVSVAPLLSQGSAPTYISSGRKVRKGSEEDEAEEQELDEAFRCRSGFQIPTIAGSVLITLRNCKPYTLWDVPTLAKRLPSIIGTISSSAPPMSKGVKGPSKEQIDRLLSLGQGKAYRVWRSFEFRPEHYSIYSHRRTIGWKHGKSTSENEDITRLQQLDGENRTYELGLLD